MNLFATATTATTADVDSTLDADASTVTAPAADAALPAPRPTLLQRLGGAALVAAPLLFTGGMLTSPEQTGPGTAGYIESLAADPALSLLSANFLHYGWVALAIGAVSALGLLRGSRGRDDDCFSTPFGSGEAADQQPDCGRFHIPLAHGNLPGNTPASVGP